jgi:lipopolysaccharide transport protein LptA
MYSKRSLNIVIIFGVFTVLIVFQAFNVKRLYSGNSSYLDVEKDQETKFEGLKYFSVEKGNPAISLNANDLKIINNNDLYFDNPTGFLFSSSGEKVDYKATSGSFVAKSKELKLRGEVVLTTKTAGHESEKVYYNGIKKYLEATGSVKSNMLDIKTRDKIKITANYLSSWMDEKRSLYLGDVKGLVSRRRIYEESFNFSADRVELNQLKSLVLLNDNVKLDRNNYHLESEKAEIFLENYNKKLKYYVLYDDIKLEEKLQLTGGQTQLRRAYSEKLEGYMAEAKIVLSGAPRVEQGEDLIKGYQITLRENVELVEVDDSQSSFELNRKE